MEYISVSELKNFLEITDNSQDAKLEDIIKRASAVLSNYVGRDLTKARRTEKYSLTMSPYARYVYLLHQPVETVHSVKLNGNTVSTDDYEVSDWGIYYKGPLVNGTLEIDYTGGYDPIPDDIREVVLMLCATYFKLDPMSDVVLPSNEKVGDVSISWNRNPEQMRAKILELYKDILDKYRPIY